MIHALQIMTLWKLKHSILTRKDSDISLPVNQLICPQKLTWQESYYSIYLILSSLMGTINITKCVGIWYFYDQKIMLIIFIHYLSEYVPRICTMQFMPIFTKSYSTTACYQIYTGRFIWWFLVHIDASDHPDNFQVNSLLSLRQIYIFELAHFDISFFVFEWIVFHLWMNWNDLHLTLILYLLQWYLLSKRLYFFISAALW